MGEALAPFRGKVAIATKFGVEPNPADGGKWSSFNSRPKHIRNVAEASLKRLKRDPVLLVLAGGFAQPTLSQVVKREFLDAWSDGR